MQMSWETNQIVDVRRGNRCATPTATRWDLTLKRSVGDTTVGINVIFVINYAFSVKSFFLRDTAPKRPTVTENTPFI